MRSKKALKNIISSIILQIVTLIFGFIIPKLIISQYGSETNGVITSITQFLGYISLLEAGFGPVVKALLYKPIAENNKEKVQNILKASEIFFKRIAFMFLIYIILLIVIYPNFVDNQFERGFTRVLILIISVSTFAEYFFGITYMLFLQAEQKTYIISWLQIFSKIINTIILFMLISIKSDIIIVKLISSIVYIGKPIIQNIYVRKVYNINLKNADKKYEIKRKWDGLSQHIAYVIHTSTDTMILTIFSNVAEVSVYSVYMLVINGIRSLITAFTSGMESSFGDMIARGQRDTLNYSFRFYEFVYFMITTIICACTLILIIPFVEVYTKGITDTDYIRPAFAIIFVLAELVYSIRRPYNSLVLAAGKFKETQVGAWVEALSNLGISCLLVFKFGILGVAIGTFVSMMIRTIEIMYYSSKNILERKVQIVAKQMLVIITQIIVITLICNLVIKMEQTDYLSLLVYAIKVGIISLIVVIPSSFIIYRNNAKMVIQIIKNILTKTK